MEELLYSVKDVFDSYLGKNGYYNIPDYQRGYKWTADNVIELLQDIENFKNPNINDNSRFYCLQNITICPASNSSQGEKVYNVVDGQQRLTTLVILLSFLGKSDIVADKIKYSVREETHDFITENIINKKIWQSQTCPEIRHKDQHYLNEVAKAIEKWFANKDEAFKEKMLETILENVKLIINKLSDNEEQIFAKLNGAKVNLDGADLLRAVMMTRSAKEKFRNKEEFYNNNQILINEFRVRMGLEIDEMNRWWGKKEVSDFFKQMIPDKTEKEAKKNGFDIDNFPINILYALLYTIHSQYNKEFSFKFFEYGLDIDKIPGNDNWELYAELRKLHLEMQDWFENKYIYHYLGYLFFRHKRNIKFPDIYEMWRKVLSKQDFILKLKTEIISCITRPYKPEDSDSSQEEDFEQLCKNIKNIQCNWYEQNDRLFNCLILQDIIAYTGNKETLGRMPVSYFNTYKEDKEHVGCQTPNGEDCNNKEKWQEYITTLKELYPKIDTDKMEKILRDNDDVNDDVRLKLIQELNSYGLNSIGNMALLDMSINRSYGNSSFADKRLEIMDNYYKGKFIRPHTLRVFVKAINNTKERSNMNHWTLKDVRQNAEEIANTLEQWITE